MKQIRLASILLCLIIALLLPVCAYAEGGVPQKILDARSSVVRVVVEANDGEYEGTGFALGIDKVEYIATNYHVVDGANSIAVWYGNNTYITATVAAKLPDSDLCVLKLSDPISGMTPMLIDDKDDAKTGDAIYALGFPGSSDVFSDERSASVDSMTVTSGIISSMKSVKLVKGGNDVKLYQIDAAINHGNSGGPLLNEAGEVIGINAYAVQDAQNTNGSIRISELISLLKQNNILYTTPQPQQPKADYTWVFILAAAVGAGVAALVIVFLVRRNGRRRRGSKELKGKTLPLDAWLANNGGRVPFEMALYILEPVMRSLAAMHARGMSRMNLGMDSIQVQPAGQAVLSEGQPKEKIGPQAMKPGFAAPEQYRTSGDIGPWCDVYAVGALLYRLVMGKPLPDAFSRMEYDADVQQEIIARKIDEAKKSAWLRAISLKMEDRFHNCGMLVEVLYEFKSVFENANAVPPGAYSTADAPTQSTAAPWPVAQQPYAYAQMIQPEPEKQKKTFKKRWIAVIAVGAAAIAIGGYFGFVEYTYQQALQNTEQKQFQQAMDNLSKLPGFYKDTQTMDDYDFASQQLSQNNYDAAQEWFNKLGDYRDSKTILTEVAYQRAKGMLQSEDYDGAKQAFASLGDYKDSKDMITESDYERAVNEMKNGQWDAAKKMFTDLGDYKDAKTMIKEVDYEHGASLIKQKDVLNALLIFKTIPDYADVSQIMPALKEAIYEQAVNDYQNGDSPSGAFVAIMGYKDVDAYLTLIKAENFASGDEETYQQLIKLAGFENADDIIMNDTFISYYLDGNWTNGEYYFRMKVESAGSWSCEYTLPSEISGHLTFENGLLKGKDSGKEQFKFTFMSPNEVVIYDYSNNSLYDMIRQ